MSARRGAIGFASIAAPCAAHAHGFGQRYDLPLPLTLYICGAALTIVVSCVMLAVCVRSAPKEGALSFDMLATRPGRMLASPAVVGAIRFIFVVLYALLLYAGFAGNPSPFRNVVPVAVWALWWVGFAYASALAGDLWKVVNPVDTIFASATRRARRTPARTIPAGLASWPAVAMYLLVLWMELAWDASDSPRAIAAAIVAYSLLTWTGMWVFGREAWLERGDAFSRLFGVLARFSPSHVALADRRIVEWKLRPYAVGLLQRDPADVSQIAFVLVLLAAVSFDGFLETPAWAAIVEAVSSEGEASDWVRTAGLLFAPLLFGAVYLVFCRLIAMSGGGAVPTRRIAGLFVLTLVPIAIAYEIAHYLSFLVQAGQYIIPLASDPFGRGWNLFGTANYFVRIGIIDARIVWIVSLVAIVSGHVAALYLGHVLSMREFPDRKAAVRSQGPMLVLMVAYTMTSLWIIAQPIVTSR